MQKDKRENYFDWDETFMQICRVIAKRSKDPHTQTGACLVNNKNIIVGLGYNGFPRGCSDDKLPWKREGDFCEKKYAFVVHAEANAILNANANVEDTRLYCTLFPCNECAKIIIQKGIKEIVYEDDKYHNETVWRASRKMLDLAKIKYKQYTPKNDLIFKKK
ncbi:MAG: cytidine deaminase [Candidatus Moranbacteria bacterium CG06_land_8_20_14_3_00_40_12]|nr:MAG: cytidine deaminase [Candidatus Moranbacteria bacterium CG23_combo_of_CG06-09_8_20_14_all_40_16]PIU80928.1 MAG: cytidine deaminase [Candidatus Moranbacteria bacterium CG06_land_8_20_14_3_00_40_12]